MFCQSAGSGCKYFLIPILFYEIWKIKNFSGCWQSSLTNLLLFFLQDFSDLHLMPGEVVAILQKAECQLMWEISHEEIEQGQLSELLIVDDYTAPSEVSKIFTFHVPIQSQHQTTYFYDSTQFLYFNTAAWCTYKSRFSCTWVPV